MSSESVVERIWSKDPSVWRGSPETPELSDRLGWLDVAARAPELASRLRDLAEAVRASYDTVILCGMGGSSLAAEVFWRVLGGPGARGGGYPTFSMLDSTVPDAVRAAAATKGKPIFVISSKSGTTVETTSFLAHFWNASGTDGSSFVAITDSGSELQQTAEDRGFYRVIEGDPDIGGRFSALSCFGLAPAALSGVDIEAVVEGAVAAVDMCRQPVGDENPAAWLGAVIGEAALAGRDKLTVSLAPPLGSFGLWLEQLVAESTGKNGKGVLPVRDDGSSGLDSYGEDRLFVSLAVADRSASITDQRFDELASRGHPTVQLAIQSPSELGGEMFRWEFATAVAAAVLGVNPFDQPNVAESKANTEEMLSSGGGGATKQGGAIGDEGIESLLSSVLPGDYVAILAYVTPTPEADRMLGTIACAVQEHVRVPVTVAYGPRYLHSTGQLHKGGPATGHYIQVVDLGGEDLPIPGASFTFGDLARAQAEGDLRALQSRNRPTVRVRSLAILEDLARSFAG